MDFEEGRKLLTKKIIQAYNKVIRYGLVSDCLFLGGCLAFVAISVFAILSK